MKNAEIGDSLLGLQKSSTLPQSSQLFLTLLQPIFNMPLQGSIQKEEVDIDGKRSALIRIATIKTNIRPQIMIMESKQAKNEI